MSTYVVLPYDGLCSNHMCDITVLMVGNEFKKKAITVKICSHLTH